MPRTNASHLHDERNSLLCRGFNVMENEIWYPIFVCDLDGKYAISDKQRIKTLKVGNRWGVANTEPKKERIRKQYMNNDGYMQVSLYDKYGKLRTFRVHRLYAIVCIPNPENKEQVNHLNSKRSDNRHENLEWSTQSENQQHSVKFGKRHTRYGQDSFFSKLTNEQALFISDSKEKNKTLASWFNVHTDTIAAVKRGKSFSSITGIIPITKSVSDRSGSNHYYTNFTEQDIIDIYTSTDGYKKLSNKYNVGKTTISAIKRGQNWGNLTKGLKRGYSKTPKHEINGFDN